MASRRSLQSHGRTSKVYVPILLHVFHRKFVPGIAEVDFSLDDIREAAAVLGLTVRNPGDVVYRMRSRTRLPEDILAHGFYILRQVGRGRYRFERAPSTLIPVPDGEVISAIDQTPLPVRRLLPERPSLFDEQAILTLIGYCGLMSHFTGLTVHRLRSHVRKSVALLGQAEIDQVDVGVAMREDEAPVIFPIEAKAADEAINRVQIVSGVLYAREYFPGHQIRPLAIKVDYDDVLQFVEFNETDSPAELEVLRSARYRIQLSDQQLRFIRASRVKH